MKLTAVSETGFDKPNPEPKPDVDLGSFVGRRDFTEAHRGKRVHIDAEHRGFRGKVDGVQIMTTDERFDPETGRDATFPVLLLDMSNGTKAPQPIDVRLIEAIEVTE